MSHLTSSTKAELRAELRARRAALTEAEWAAASARVCDALLTHAWLQSARGVALFAPLTARREVDVSPVANVLRSRGVTVFYPLVTGSGANCTGSFHAVESEAELVLGAFGVAQPAATQRVAERGDIDVVVVPCLAVTSAGQRLGYGSGFYDRVLPNVCPPGQAIAVAFAFQLVAELPTSPHDFLCDAVITR